MVIVMPGDVELGVGEAAVGEKGSRLLTGLGVGIVEPETELGDASGDDSPLGMGGKGSGGNLVVKSDAWLVGGV